MAAEAAFDDLFIKKQTPDDMPEFHLTQAATERTLIDILPAAKILETRSEVRRMIKQNAVSIDDKKISDELYKFESNREYIVKVGKRKFLRVLCS